MNAFCGFIDGIQQGFGERGILSFHVVVDAVAIGVRSVACSKHCVANRVDVVAVVVARVPGIPRFHCVESFFLLPCTVFFERVADFVFSYLVGDFHATVDDLFDGIDGVRIFEVSGTDVAILVLAEGFFSFENAGVGKGVAL